MKAQWAYLRPLLVPVAGAYLLLGLVTRIVLWAVFSADSHVRLSGLLSALAVGAANDSIELAYIFLPVSIVSLLLPKRVQAGTVGRLLFPLVLYATVFGAIFLAIAEVLFFEEFESRFNLVAVDYLFYPTEVAGNIFESYPVVPIVAVLALFALPITFFIVKRTRRSLVSVPNFGSRFSLAAAHSVVVCAIAFILSADSIAPFPNRFTRELALNGLGTFFQALRTEGIDYHAFYRTLPSEVAFSNMRTYFSSFGQKFVSNDVKSLVREFPEKPTGLGKLNVIILSEESFGAQYVGTYGNPEKLTPSFDALAPEGLIFKNAFATGTRTVRGLEAMSASFPPIPSESIVKRPGSDHISNWGAVMKQHGYHVSFLYGGFGMFDSMNSYFGSNGFELSDRTNIDKVTFSNIWGVCDEDLFNHAIEYFDAVAKSGQPIFSLIMTTSNHKPFTFPDGIPGIPAKGGGRKAGVKYADYAIGKFFEHARSHSWFSNTLFIVIADHDSRVYGRAAVPVEHYRIPALFYAPGKLPAGTTDKYFSNMDLAPTVMGLLGLPYTAPFYGVDVLDERVPAVRPVLLSHNHDVAIYQEGEMSVLGLNKSARTYLYKDQKTVETKPNNEMIELLTSYLQTGYELFQEHKY